MMYGAVLFDDDDDESGWAAISGKDAVRVERTSELPYDVYWWANRGPESMRGFLPRFKTHSYLTPTMLELHLELGILEMGPEKKTKITAEIFGRVMTMARDYYGIMSPQKNTLAEDISNALLPREKLPEQFIHDALREAHVQWVDCSAVEQSDEMEIHTLVLPRVQHAINVLSSPVPGGNKWEKAFTSRGIPPTHVQPPWVSTREMPMLAKISIQGIDPKVASLLPYSEFGDPQRWVTHSEFLMLSKFSKPNLEVVHFCEKGYQGMTAEHSFYPGGYLSPISISAGILAANYLAAMTAPQNNGRVEPGRNAEIYTPQATWLAAADRHITLASALSLKLCNFEIAGYGQGKIRVLCMPDHLLELRDTAGLLGLEVALNLAKTGLEAELESADT